MEATKPPTDSTTCEVGGPVKSNQEPEEERQVTEEEWMELRARTWSIQEALFFGGDGRESDTLGDISFESKVGADQGLLLFRDLLWIPGWCFCCCRRSCKRRFGSSTERVPSPHKCVAAVKGLSRLMRQCHMLAALLEPGFETGADRCLQDPKILEALGPHGTALAKAGKDIAADIESLLHPASLELEHVESAPSIPASTFGVQSEIHAEDNQLRGSLTELHERVQLLLEAGAASRLAAGGLLAPGDDGVKPGFGGFRCAAVLFVVREIASTLSKTEHLLVDKPNKSFLKSLVGRSQEGYDVVALEHAA